MPNKFLAPLRSRYALAELLERRQLFSADLTGTFTGTIPSALPPQGSNKLSVHVVNQGDESAAGTVTVSLYASADQTLDVGDTFLASKNKTKTLGIDAGTTLKVKFDSPTDVPDGNYFILADIESDDPLVNGNVIATPGTVSIRQPFVDLAAEVTKFPSGAVTIGGSHQKSTKVTLRATNNGNVRAKGKVDLNVFASTDQTLDANDTLLITKAGKSVNIKAGKNTKFDLKKKLAATVPSGTFFFLAQIVPGSGITDDDGSNDVASSASPVTINNPLIPVGAPSAFSLESDASALVVGEPESVGFSARAIGAAPSGTVRLDELDSNGNVIGKATDLFDDGSPLHNDATAGDGRFNNVVAVSFDTPGQRTFRAALSTSAGGEQQTNATVIQGINAPTDAATQQAADDNTAISQQAKANLAAGQTDAQILQGLQFQLAASDSSKVRSGSIQTAGSVISWTTGEGFLSAIDLVSLRMQHETEIAAQSTLSASSQVAQTMSASALSVPVAPSAHEANPALCKRALIIDPREHVLRPGGTQSGGGAITSLFAFHEYDTFHILSTSATLDKIGAYASFAAFDVVVILSTGNVVPGTGLVIDTGVEPSLALVANPAFGVTKALVRGGLTLFNGALGVTPTYIRQFGGQIQKSIIFVDTANSLADNKMADAFLERGAADYLGFSDVHSGAFGQQQMANVFNTLLPAPPAPPAKPKNTVIDIPSLYTETDPTTGATLTDRGDNTAAVPLERCPNLNDHDLFIEYTWPQTVKDLDTNTEFLGVTSGFSGDNNSPYITWSGDNTSDGGVESATINLLKSYQDGKWSTTVTITAHAGWYQPSNGRGPATLKVGLKNKQTGALIRTSIKTIDPGKQDHLATQLVDTITITITDVGSLKIDVKI